MKLKGIIISLAVCLLILGEGYLALGQEKFPTKPMTLYYPARPGSATNLSCVAACKAAEKYLGQPILLEYKIDLGLVLAPNTVARSKPDGYSLGSMFPAVMCGMPFLLDLPFDVIKDFDPICQFAFYHMPLVVKSDSPWNTFQEFIDHVKKNPGKVSYATAGAGTGSDLSMRWLARKFGLKMNIVPYKGSGEAVPAVLGGHVDSGALDGSALPHVKAGKLRLLAFLSLKRNPDFPNVPSFETLGFDFDCPSFNGIMGPAGLPEHVLQVFDDAFRKGMDDPAFLDVLKNIGMGPIYRNPVTKFQFIKKPIGRYRGYSILYGVKV
jgi:tripartite-type tricarboxylate transporter receptor subunit TctC